MAKFDAVIVGAGHNALVCAGYLAKAGWHVCVVERRGIVGGAVVTEEIIPGYKFDLGGSAHILINHTPIVADLRLETYGLEYIDLDPLFFAPFPDGTSITFWRDVDRTCESIAAISPADAIAYRAFIDEWTPIAHAMVESFLHPPSLPNLARYMGWKMYRAASDFPKAITSAFRGYGQVLRENFRDPRVQAAIGWMAAQSGPPPGEPLSGPFALWHPMYHVSGMRRPRGGSGMLTQAIANMIVAHGGEVRVDAPVRAIRTTGNKATAVELESGEVIEGARVVSGAHIHTTMAMLGDAAPEAARKRLGQARIGNGFGMVLRCATDALPNYTAAPSQDAALPEPHHQALQFLCPSMAYLERAYGDYLAGRPSDDPALIAMTFSAADPTLAPPGKHTLFLWGQYYPYELASGESWDSIGDRVADRMIDKLAEYAPNMKDAITGRLVEHPLYLERTLGLLRGNVMHLEMSIDQMFALRPALGHSMYRGPVRGLYLTGASTHPGGGIMGAAGRNAALTILADARWNRHG